MVMKIIIIPRRSHPDADRNTRNHLIEPSTHLADDYVQASFMTQYFPQPDVEEQVAKRMRENGNEDDEQHAYGRRRVCSLNELLEVRQM
jgi:hypothetical protein